MHLKQLQKTIKERVRTYARTRNKVDWKIFMHQNLTRITNIELIMLIKCEDLFKWRVFFLSTYMKSLQEAKKSPTFFAANDNQRRFFLFKSCLLSFVCVITFKLTQSNQLKCVLKYIQSSFDACFLIDFCLCVWAIDKPLLNKSNETKKLNRHKKTHSERTKICIKTWQSMPIYGPKNLSQRTQYKYLPFAQVECIKSFRFSSFILDLLSKFNKLYSNIASFLFHILYICKKNKKNWSKKCSSAWVVAVQEKEMQCNWFDTSHNWLYQKLNQCSVCQAPFFVNLFPIDRCVLINPNNVSCGV